MKNWLLKIEACGYSQEEAAKQVVLILDRMLNDKEGRSFTIGKAKGNAVGNWSEGPEMDDENTF